MPCVVILTARSLEYLAVRAHISGLEEEEHPQGTVYEVGYFTGEVHTWKVCIAEIGIGNPVAAQEAERAIAYFSPEIVISLGLAYGLQGILVGDVVVSTKVYNYESGQLDQVFSPRIELGHPSYRLIQRARVEARSTNWTDRISLQKNNSPSAHLGAIAAGEKEVKGESFNLIADCYSDSLALETEGIGVLSAVNANENIGAIVIRGISRSVQCSNLESRESARVDSLSADKN